MGEAISRSGSMPAVKMPDEGCLCHRCSVSWCVGVCGGRWGEIGKVVGTAWRKSLWDPCGSGQVSLENQAGIGECGALAGLHGLR